MPEKPVGVFVRTALPRGVWVAKVDVDIGRYGQARVICHQTGGRVAFFLVTEDFERDFAAYSAAGVNFTEDPRTEPYGIVAVFRDCFGNLWDLIQPTSGGLTRCS